MTPQDTSYTILLDWWTALEADKGERAELKRAENPLRVVFSPAYHDLLYRLQEAGYRLGTGNRERLALLAGLAAHVKQHTDNSRSLATQMGSPKPGSDKAPVSESTLPADFSNGRSWRTLYPTAAGDQPFGRDSESQ